MRFKSLKKGKIKEYPEEEVIEVETETASQLAEMHEHISSKTKNLEETTQRLQELSDTLNGSGEEKVEERPKPHGPLGELSIEPEDKMMDIDLETPADEELLATAGDEIQVVEVGNDSTTKAETTDTEDAQLGAEATPDAEETEDDSFSNLFNSEEEEVNTLATLINSLPDVSAQELVDDLQEIKDIILDNKKTR